MKKMLPFIFIILFPYYIVFLISSLFNQYLMKYIFQNNFYLGLLSLCIFWFIAFISAIILCVNNFANKMDVIEATKIIMIIKIIQIPAYLFIFVAGVMCLFTIFTVGISFVLLILDGASIILSGLIGVFVVRRCYADRILTNTEMVIHSILQFVFCLDVVSAIIVFRKVKTKNII
ncbi:MAG: hypothetical protein OSJ73_03295 [Lachnospiraceae bacterium]|nr:hypothetical protein [Lachnospiraceae bacterium]HBV84846.1 hypothetical protein [Lachnospiraceae bacterium]